MDSRSLYIPVILGTSRKGRMSAHAGCLLALKPTEFCMSNVRNNRHQARFDASAIEELADRNHHPGWRYIGFGCIHRYDVPAPHPNVLSQPQVRPASREQLAELLLCEDPIAHRFAGAVVACAPITGHRSQP